MAIYTWTFEVNDVVNFREEKPTITVDAKTYKLARKKALARRIPNVTDENLLFLSCIENDEDKEKEEIKEPK